MEEEVGEEAVPTTMFVSSPPTQSVVEGQDIAHIGGWEGSTGPEMDQELELVGSVEVKM
jgi:hypothetical protein